MKKIIYIILGIVIATAGTVYAAPLVSFQPTLVPIFNNTYDLGTSTSRWRDLFTNNIYLYGVSDGCLYTLSNIITSTGSACGAGGGGSGGGTWSTTTSQHAGRLINYPNNTTDIVNIGSNSTTTGKVYFDPNTQSYQIGSISTASTTIVGNATTTGRFSAAYFNGSGTATSTLTGGLAANIFNATSVTASSTFANGINVTTGCFAINGTCVGTGAGTVTAVTGTYPIVSSGGTTPAISIAFGTTTSNTWAGTQTFTNAPILSSLTGLLLGNGSSALTAASTQTCTNQFFRSLSSAFSVTCATVANTDLANSTISGVALGGTLNALTATNGTLTFSGSYDGSAARTAGLNLGNANTWTALQQFGANASTTGLSAGYAYFGTTATTSISNTGVVTLATSTAGCLANSTTGIVFSQTCGSFTNTLANGGTATTTFYNGGVVFSDGSKLTQSSASSNFFWDETNKRLGLGTSSPSQLLSINATAPQMTFQTASNGGRGLYIGLPDSANGTINSTGGYTLLQNSGTNALATLGGGVAVGSYAAVNAPPTNGLIVSGNTGIGTTSPFARLSVAGAGTGLGYAVAVTDVSSTTRFVIQDNGRVGIGTTTPTATLNIFAGSQTIPYLDIGSTTSSIMTVKPSASTLVGIATTSPWRTLSVAGTVAFPSLTSATGKNSVCVDSATGEVVTAGNTTCLTSSKKTKHDIDNLSITESQRIIMALNPVAFTYNDGNDRRVGFVAEDVNKIDPRLVELAQVDTNFPKASGVIKKGEPISVEYGNVTALLVKVVQDQQKKIGNLAAGGRRAAEENWQWILIGLLAIGFIYQQFQINKLKQSNGYTK